MGTPSLDTCKHFKTRLLACIATSLLLASLPAFAQNNETPAAAAEQAPAPLETFFRAPILTKPLPNEAGTHFIALTTLSNDKNALLLVDIREKEPRIGTLNSSGNKDIYNYAWLGNDRLFYSLSTDTVWSDGIYTVDIADLGACRIIGADSSFSLVGVPKARPHEPIVWIAQDAYDNGRDTGAVRLDSSKSLWAGQQSDKTIGVYKKESYETLYGTAATISHSYAKPPGDTSYYMTDAQGELRFAECSDKGVKSLYYLENDKWIRSTIDPYVYEIVQAGDEGTELVVVAPSKEGKPRALHRMDAKTGELGELLHQDAKYDCDVWRIYRHPVTRRVIGFQFPTQATQSVWFLEDYKKIQKFAENSLPGQVVAIIGSDQKERRFFLSAYSDKSPVNYYVLDLDAGSFKRITQSRPWVNPETMLPMQPMRYKTRDGKSIEAFLTLPRNASKQNPPPLVVLPHGGPWSRDEWGWDSEVQFLASRGYAVFQPNYRGSTSYTFQFTEADNYDFRKMHEDVTDGVQKLIKSGLVDADRIAIMGASFGGYLSLCGVAFEPSLYRCAISFAGVFDWRRMIRETRRADRSSSRSDFYIRHLGDPEKNKEYFETISPLAHVANIKAPVLIAHGQEDSTVDIAQSQRLVAELKKYNIPYKSLFEGNESHGLVRLESRLAYYREVEAFLAANMTPRPR